MKKNLFLFVSAASVSMLILLSCSSTPPPSSIETKEQPASSAQEGKKARTITLLIPRLMKETVLFPDGAEDEYTLYTYSPKGTLLKEELYDASSRQLLEYSEYLYENVALAEKRTYDGNQKVKNRKTYRYEKALLVEESLYDKADDVQIRSLNIYDSQNRKIEWRTLDASGSVIGINRYGYGSGTTPERIELLGPGENLELTITVSYANGRKEKERFELPNGRIEKEIVYTYDDKGRLTSETTYSDTKIKISSTLFEYPVDKNEPTRAIYRDAQDKPKKIVQYEYEYHEEKRVVYE